MRDWLNTLASDHLSDADDMAVAGCLAADLAASGETAARAAMELAQLIGEGATDAAALIAALETLPTSDSVTVAAATTLALAMHAIAAARADYSDRPAAASARTLLAARADVAYGLIGEDLGPQALMWVTGLVGRAVRIISDELASLVPLVRVETALSMPASVLAFQLYGDASRGEELVARNGVLTPLVMPKLIEARAS